MLLVLLVALINSLCWAFLIPPFQGPDEHGHFAYAQYLAESGKLPGKKDRKVFSTEQFQAFTAINYNDVQSSLDARPPFTDDAEESWRQAAKKLKSDQRKDGGGETFATPNPPLFHGYQALAYRVGGGDIFQRFTFMRLASALLFLGTVAFTWALAGQLFGTALWPRAVASLAVALQPMATYVLTSVHPDSLLTFLFSGALYFGVRLLKGRPRTTDLFALSAFVGLALMTKLVSPALLPATLFAFVAVAHRSRSRWKTNVLLRNIGVAAAIIAVPLLVWSLAYPLLGEKPISAHVASTVTGGGKGVSISSFLSYLWQWYLPQLPFMDTFPQTLGVPVYDTMLRGFWGAFGPWLLLDYPGWLKASLAAFMLGLAALAMLALARARRRALENWQPLLYLGLVAVALLFTVHYVSYKAALDDQPFFQSRYLFPLISLFGASVALAVSAFKGVATRVAAAVVVALFTAINMVALAANADRFLLEPDRDLSLASLPDIFHRAAQFGAGWEGAWLYWLLFIATLLTPILAGLALFSAFSYKGAFKAAPTGSLAPPK